jgi:phosphatidylserine/phosphatidylglycerophosphate/cardiolipin synthase-like enzyme
MIVDDEIVCCGSANLVDLSMTLSPELHTEICLGVLDETFAEKFRKKLFLEHVGNANVSFDEFDEIVSQKRCSLFRMSPKNWGIQILSFAVQVYEKARK